MPMTQKSEREKKVLLFLFFFLFFFFWENRGSVGTDCTLVLVSFAIVTCPFEGNKRSIFRQVEKYASQTPS